MYRTARFTSSITASLTGRPGADGRYRRRRRLRPRSLRPARVALASSAVAALALTGLTVGQASASVRARSSSAPETPTLTVPLGAASAGVGDTVFALSSGSFKRFGLTVSEPLSSEGPLKSGFAAGAYPLVSLAGSDVLDLAGKRYPIEAVGCTGNSTSFDLYARSSIIAPADLAGAKIGVPSLGGAPQFGAELFLEEHKVPISSVTFVPLGSIPDVLAALEAGDIDAAPLSVPFNLQAKAKGLFDLGASDGPPTPIVVKSTWAKTNGNTILDYLRGYASGTWLYDTNEKDALPVLASFLGDSLSNPTQAKAVTSGYEAYLPPVSYPATKCHAQSFQKFIQFLPASEQKKVNLKDLVNNSYVDKLASQGFYTALQGKYGALPGNTQVPPAG